MLKELLERLQDERVVEAKIREGDRKIVYSLSHEVLVPKVAGWYDEREMLRKKADETLRALLAEYHRTGGLLSEPQVQLVDQWLQRPYLPGEEELLAISRDALNEARLAQQKRSEWDRLIRRVGIGVFGILALLGIAVLYFSYTSLEARTEDLHERGLAAFDGRDMLSAEMYFAQALVLKDSVLSRILGRRGDDFEIRGHLLQARVRGLRSIAQYDPRGKVLAVSPDLKTTVVSSNNVLMLKHASDGSIIQRLPPQKGYPITAVFNATGDSVAYAYGNKPVINSPVTNSWHVQTEGAVHIWSMAAAREIALIPLTSPDARTPIKQVSGMAFNQKADNVESVFAFATEDGMIQVWSLNPPKRIRTLTGHKLPVWGLAFQPGGKLLASASEDKTVRLWHLDGVAGQGIILKGHEDVVMSVAFSPIDPTLLASASADGTVRLWNVQNNIQLRSLTGHFGTVVSVVFQPEGALLASGCEDDYVRIFDLDSGSEVASLLSREGPVQALGFGPTGLIFAGGSKHTGDNEPVTTGWAKLWSIGSSNEVRTFFNGTSALGMAIAGSNKLISGDAAGAIKFWSYEGNVIRTVQTHSNILSGGVSKDEHWLATGSDSGVDLYDLKNLDSKPRHLYEGGEVWGLSFDPTGDHVAFGSDRKICICPVQNSLQPCFVFNHYGGKVWNVAYSPDGKMLASAGGDNSVRLWDPKTGTEMHRYNGHTGDVYSVAYLAGGNVLASGSVDRTIRLLDSSSLSVLRVLEGHQGSITNLSAVVQGVRLASASLDHTVRIWNTQDGSHIDLGIDERPVWWVSISKNGQYMASAGLSRQLRVWDLSAIDRFFSTNSTDLLRQAADESGLDIVGETIQPRTVNQ